MPGFQRQSRFVPLGGAAIRTQIIKLQHVQTLLRPQNMAECSERPPAPAKKKNNMENQVVTSKSFRRPWWSERKKPGKGYDRGRGRERGPGPRA